MKKNVWQTLDSHLCMQEDLVKDNGHSLVMVLRKSGLLSKKTVHKEFGTLSLYGAVANMCKEYEPLHDRSGRPDMVGQSIVLSAIKTEVSLESDDPAYQNFLFQQYEERIERLSQQDKVNKFCMDAGFLSVV